MQLICRRWHEKGEISCKFCMENGKYHELTFFDLQIHPLPPIFKRGGMSERPELAGSKIALLFFPDCWNSEMSKF
jgi:hypothetical protein